MNLISVDIGFKGGFSVFHNFELKEVYPMPIYYTEVIKKIKGKKKKVKQPNLYIPDIVEILRKADVVIIEDIHSLPKDGRVSAFRFGWQKGIISGIAIGYVGTNNVIYVSPQTWKKYFGLGKDKKKSVELANKLFNLELKNSQDGIAEAILLGYFYLKNFGGQLNGSTT